MVRPQRLRADGIGGRCVHVCLRPSPATRTPRFPPPLVSHHPSFPTTPRFPAPCERQAISLFRLFDVDLTGSVSVANIKAIVFEGATSGWLTKSRPNRVALTSAKPRRGSGSGETYLTEGSVSEAGMPPASSGHADGTGGSAGSTRAPRRKSTKVRPVDDRAPSVGAPERQ